MEVPDSSTRIGQKYQRSSEPMGDIDRCRREYYLHSALDALKIAVNARQWLEHRNAVFTDSLAQAKSLFVVVSFFFCSIFVGVVSSLR